MGCDDDVFGRGAGDWFLEVALVCSLGGELCFDGGVMSELA